MKVLSAIGLDKDYKDCYRTEYGAVVLEKTATKEQFEIPYATIHLIMHKYRGFEQKVLLDELKRVILAHGESSKQKPGNA